VSVNQQMNLNALFLEERSVADCVNYSRAVLLFPFTSTFCLICVGVFVYIWQNKLGFEDVGVSYTKCIRRKEYWRIWIASLSHIQFIHLVFNITSMWNLRFLEIVGFRIWIQITLYLLLFSILLYLLIVSAIIHIANQTNYGDVHSLGASCIVFGWMTIGCFISPNQQWDLFGLLSIPLPLAPFGALIFAQILMPQSSFWGHLAGILSGIMLYLVLFYLPHFYSWVGFFIFHAGLIGIVYLVDYLPLARLHSSSTVNMV